VGLGTVFCGVRQRRATEGIPQVCRNQDVRGESPDKTRQILGEKHDGSPRTRNKCGPVRPRLRTSAPSCVDVESKGGAGGREARNSLGGGGTSAGRGPTERCEFPHVIGLSAVIGSSRLLMKGRKGFPPVREIHCKTWARLSRSNGGTTNAQF